MVYAHCSITSAADKHAFSVIAAACLGDGCAVLSRLAPWPTRQHCICNQPCSKRQQKSPLKTHASHERTVHNMGRMPHSPAPSFHTHHELSSFRRNTLRELLGQAALTPSGANGPPVQHHPRGIDRPSILLRQSSMCPTAAQTCQSQNWLSEQQHMLLMLQTLPQCCCCHASGCRWPGCRQCIQDVQQPTTAATATATRLLCSTAAATRITH